MCQLLGLNCATPTDASFSFTGFCQRGGNTG
ncbi:MAG: class II glutamine amidotransferase, partial [Hydrogenophaga sp.]|nr:class II glutamine amidotransferase [Hydrogenophaga sp.]